MGEVSILSNKNLHKELYGFIDMKVKDKEQLKDILNSKEHVQKFFNGNQINIKKHKNFIDVKAENCQNYIKFILSDNNEIDTFLTVGNDNFEK
jgi:hypothetical protein